MWGVASKEIKVLDYKERVQVIVVGICKSALVDKYFISLEGGKLCWQGRVIAQVSNELYLIETFDWLESQPFDMRLVSIGGMADWRFYDSQETMVDHFRRYEKQASEMMAHGE